MALFFHPTYSNFIMGIMMWRKEGLGRIEGSVASDSTLQTAKSITIYSGVQPSATDFETNFNTTYRNNHLVHFDTSSWEPLVSGTGDARIDDITQYYIYILPAPTAATASGTATWAVLWYNPVSYTTISSAIGASFYAGSDGNYGRYVIVPVSDNAGNGLIKLLSTTIVSGNLVDLQSGSFNYTVTPII